MKILAEKREKRVEYRDGTNMRWTIELINQVEKSSMLWRCYRQSSKLQAEGLCCGGVTGRAPSSRAEWLCCGGVTGRAPELNSYVVTAVLPGKAASSRAEGLCCEGVSGKTPSSRAEGLCCGGVTGKASSSRAEGNQNVMSTERKTEA